MCNAQSRFYLRRVVSRANPLIDRGEDALMCHEKLKGRGRMRQCEWLLGNPPLRAE